MRTIRTISALGFVAFALFLGCTSEGGIDSAYNSQTGIGGSMSRFTVGNDHLFLLTEKTLKVFKLSDTDEPFQVGSTKINDVVETLFIKDSTLFIGSQNGMHIYDVSTPSSPRELSVYRHITSCDPVVVSGNTAYVTLRSGSECGGGQNLVEVIDVSNLNDPILKNSYGTAGPYGLAVADSHLLVCKGDAGLTVYDRSGFDLLEQQTFDSIDSYDVIALPDFAIVTGDEGIHQLDIRDMNNITKLSLIPSLSSGIE